MGRGLAGVKPVISDAHEGLKAAVAKVLHATWQRCRVHCLRNALAYANTGRRQTVFALIDTISAQESAEHEVLAFMDFPDERAIRRLVGALRLEQNDECAIQERCLEVGSMARPSENPTIRLPAAPALA